MSISDTDRLYAYNALDCIGTLSIQEAFSPELVLGGFEETYNYTVRLYEPLIYMMTAGLAIDNERLTNTKIQIEKELKELQLEINERCGRPLNPNSSDDCKKYFYIERGIPAYTKRGNKPGQSIVTCDDKALQRIAKGTSNRKGLYEAKLIQRFRGLQKLKGTYLEIDFDRDGRLRCAYNPRGTKFGRLSSGKTVFDTGMNMQNLPAEFKGFIVADPGYVFIELDKRQAEWVVVAYVSGDENMMKILQDGGDPHAYTASQMFGIDMQTIKEESKYIGYESNPDKIEELRISHGFYQRFQDKWIPRTMSMRQCGKKSNHGLNYDETYRMFSMINEITEKEASVIIDLYHRIYPGIRGWHKKIQGQLAKDRTLKNCLGRKCRFLDRWGEQLFKSAYSFEPQSTVVDVVNRGLIDIYEDSSDYMKELRLGAQVHDSILMQMPINNLTNIAKSVKACRKHLNPTLYANGREYVIETDMKIGFNWGSMHEIAIVDDTDEQEKLIKEKISELQKAERLAVGIS